jgi:hypothetical protein
VTRDLKEKEELREKSQRRRRRKRRSGGNWARRRSRRGKCERNQLQETKELKKEGRRRG